MSSTPHPSLIGQMASMMLGRAKDVGMTEQQVLQLLGFRQGVGPLETLLSGRPPHETIPEIVGGIKEGTDEMLKMTKASVEQAIPLMVTDELKPLLRKISVLTPEGVSHLDVYVNFLMSQGFVKK